MPSPAPLGTSKRQRLLPLERANLAHPNEERLHHAVGLLEFWLPSVSIHGCLNDLYHIITQFQLKGAHRHTGTCGASLFCRQPPPPQRKEGHGALAWLSRIAAGLGLTAAWPGRPSMEEGNIPQKSSLLGPVFSSPPPDPEAAVPPAY